MCPGERSRRSLHNRDLVDLPPSRNDHADLFKPGADVSDAYTGMNRGFIKVSRLYKCIYNILIYMV